MDARDRLRRYLEQRREMGESEFALDSMSVEEALRVMSQGRSGPSAPPNAPRAERAAPSAPETAAPASGDWREALRATGSAPSEEPLRPAKPSPLPPAPAAASPQPTPAPVADRPLPAAAGPASVPSDLPPGLVVGKPATLGLSEIESLPSLDAIAEMVRRCTRCPLHATAIQGVPGEGNPEARFVCVGEAPGATEDETGRPFVGAAGQLLTKILAAINLRREDVFICNVIKHRPPGNRNPLPNEIAACSPYLIRQLELIRPSVILALGTFAAQTLLETKESIGKLRGRVHRYHGIPLVVTYHPAALLRNPSWKRPTWDDVQLARRILDSSPRAGA
ncbi:MAG TPA: uracil-DNA glycosylase [Gemmatimonadaceae bacterium]|nr:uracil-DNA glycosylase [Gemmatimonadaceae bacterium]